MQSREDKGGITRKIEEEMMVQLQLNDRVLRYNWAIGQNFERLLWWLKNVDIFIAFLGMTIPHGVFL